jgi:peptidoglycan hydrolase-like protein with peptidoglycan-binding domain
MRHLTLLLAATGLAGAFGAPAAMAAEQAPASADPESTPATSPTAPSTPGASPTDEKPPTSKPAAHTRILHVPPSQFLDGSLRLHVSFSAALVPGSAVPTLSPHVAGTWKARGANEVFTPASTLQPCSTYTLTIWGRTVATGYRPLGKRHTLTLHVACPSVRALQQALARLRYLPFELRSRHRANTDNRRESRAQAAHYAFHPPGGRMVSYVPHAPGLWYGALDPTTRGALMVFQVSNGLPVTGSPDARTWATLLSDEAKAHSDPRPYTFVTVSERIPETLQVHEGHNLVLSTPTNTGVPGAMTQVGTFPIYARYTSTTMIGTNPDGSHYSDPGVPWVNYFNGGDAVHGFPRPSYGTPQSNGCVELPIGTAEQVYRLLSIGDLVIVS